jgi:hypothetical protein
MARIVKIWIESDRAKSDWHYYGNSRDSRWDTDKIVKKLQTGKHDSADGMDVMNALLKDGGKLIATHHATTGGMCVGIVALVELKK